MIVPQHVDLPSNHGVVHDWLVWLVLEVRVPSASEVWCWPGVHLPEFFLCWADLNTSINTVCSQWTCALDVPFVKDSLLDLWVASDEFIEGLGSWLGAVDYIASEAVTSNDLIHTSKRQVVVLEVLANTWKVDNRLDANGSQLLGVTQARSLKDEWR